MREVGSKWLFVALIFAVIFVCGRALRGQTRTGVTHALLIGVTNYPNLDKRYALAGPANDVELVRDVLAAEPFNVDPRRITRLAETPAASATKPGGPGIIAGRPTKANIAHEFNRLAKEVNAGDQVVIFFAGHGSQQPDDDPNEEDDRLDEIVLPADAQNWNGGTETVLNAITDDEIANWLGAIRKRGAFVWAVFDACQSTSLTRGTDVEVNRFVPPDALGVPEEKLRAAGRGRSLTGENAMLGLDDAAGNIAALYAAQTIEPTPEKLLPDGPSTKVQDRKVHGLFTFTLVTALREAGLARASTRLTYRDLAERVIQHYRAMGRIAPTPGFEGGGLDREVLGVKDFAGTVRLVLGDRIQNGLEVRAGAVHGLSIGTILRVYPAANRPATDTPIGHVKLTSVTPASSVAEPVAYAGMPAPDPKLLRPGSYCDVAFYDYADRVFKVALHQEPGTSIETDIIRYVETALAELEKTTNGRATRVKSPSEANWLVRVTPARAVVLTPASGWEIDPSRPDGDQSQGRFVVAELGPQQVGDKGPSALTQELSRVLNALARATNLLRLAVAPENQQSAINIDVDLLRYRNKQDTTGSVVGMDNGVRRLYIGEEIGFRLRNTSSVATDVTLLVVDADYAINALFPLAGTETDARIPGGAERHTGRISVTAPIGFEHAVLIAVEASGVRQDFGSLQQPPLTRLVTRGGPVAQEPTNAMNALGLPTSPLGELLKSLVHGMGTRGGVAIEEVGAFSLEMITWRTHEATKP